MLTLSMGSLNTPKCEVIKNIQSEKMLYNVIKKTECEKIDAKEV